MEETAVAIADVWKAADKDLQEYYSQEAYCCFLSQITPLWAEGDFFAVSSPNEFYAEPILTTYQKHIEEILYNKTGNHYRLRVFLQEEDLAELRIVNGETYIIPADKTSENVNILINESEANPGKKTSNLWGQEFPPKPYAITIEKATPYNEPERKKFKTKEEYIHDLRKKELFDSAHTDFSRPNGYHSHMTFDNLIVGSNNEFAVSASRAVADMPATKYNPLFIYGGSGLGKTHLLHAIGHKIQGNHPDWDILYTTTEKFMNDFIKGIRTQSTAIVRDFFRGFDVLLIDDIQFVEKKESTQEEFFNTFNTLKTAGKQIVITSDRPVREMPLLMERLRTRIEGGLLASITAPEYETRVAILRQKLENTAHGDDIPSEVVEWVAEQIQDNIRELEGAAAKLSAYTELGKTKTIDLETANAILIEHIHGVTKTCVDTLDIISEVERFFSLSKNALFSNSRTKDLVQARQIAMFLCRELTGKSYPDIGKAFGGRDHSTVIHSINKIKNEMKNNLNILTTVNTLKDKLC